MRKTIGMLSLGMCLCSFESAFSEGEICEKKLETPYAVPIERHKIGKSIVTAIPDSGYAKLSDSLKEVEGLRIKKINGQSGLTTFRIRGTRSIDAKILYDGIPLSDPSDPQGSANPLIGDLSTVGIGSVEILKGASSSVHGTDAQGGVINLLSDLSEKMTAFSEFGTFYTFREGMKIGRKMGDAILSVSGERTDSDGFDHHDDYEQSSFAAAFKKSVLGESTFDVSFLGSETDARLNGAPFISGGALYEDQDDENDTRENGLAHFGARLSGPLSEGTDYLVKVGFTDSERRFTFLPNSDRSGFFSDGTFEGKSFFLHEQVSFKHSEKLTSTLGHSFRREFLEQKTYIEPFFPNLKDESDQYANDYFVEEIMSLGPTTLAFAGRLNTHESAKRRLTFDASAAHVLPTFTILRAHYGTAFREPSLFELDGAFLSSFGRFHVGNKNLSPERSKGWDVGFEHPFKDVTFGASVFRTDIQNRIDFVGVSYENVDGQFHSQGADGFVRIDVGKWSARGSYTYLDGSENPDIPTNQWSLSLRGEAGKFTAYFGGFYTGGRQIVVFNTDSFTLDRTAEKSYFTADAKIGYKLKDNTEIYVRGENIFDEDYTEGGYRTPRARVYGGAVLSF